MGSMYAIVFLLWFTRTPWSLCSFSAVEFFNNFFAVEDVTVVVEVMPPMPMPLSRLTPPDPLIPRPMPRSPTLLLLLLLLWLIPLPVPVKPLPIVSTVVNKDELRNNLLECIRLVSQEMVQQAKMLYSLLGRE
uniref:Secreted protein n=1 Tax=Glossina austeni TaxID=7395 RepID=A0A1A9VIT1_GLOAU